MSGRYKVLAGSQSGHCCFDYTVVDTLKPHPVYASQGLFDAICETLVRRDRVEIRGFGSFGLTYRPGRTGRNPKTGEKVAVPGKWVMLERWQDQAGLTQHMASAHFQALTQALNGRVDSVQIDQLQPAC